MVEIDPVSIQIESFLITVLCGIIIGLLFDGYRILRGILNPRTFVTDIGDLIFWALSTLVVYTTLLFTNWGEVRLYVFIGLAIGLTVHIKLFSRPVTSALVATLRYCGMGYRCFAKYFRVLVWQPALKLIALLASPFLWIYRKPGRYFINTSCSMGKSYKDTIIKRWFRPKEPPG